MFEENIQNYLNKYGFKHIRLKAVLFDMDGVLFDSMPLHSHSWVEAAKRHNLDMTAEEVYEYEGRTGKSTINILTKRSWRREATDKEIREIYQTKSNIFNSFPEAPSMNGALELLRQVKNDGFQIILVTGSGQMSLLERLDHNFPHFFHNDTMVTSFNVHHGKPSPEPYLQALKKAAVKPWEAVVVENAPLGIRAGVAAKIFTIALNTGPLPDSKLLCERTDLLFQSMADLAKKWTEIRDALQ